MSHIHIPDGIIPPFLWIAGYLITIAIIFMIIRKINPEEARKKIPFTGLAAAIMLIGMSVPLFIIPVHLSLAVLTGILVGPSLGFLAVFAVNITLALFGHGGITVAGINTLVIGSEVLIGYYLFNALKNRISLFGGAFMATVLAVMVSLSMMVGLVAYTAGVAEALPHGNDEHHDCAFHTEDHEEEISHAVEGVSYFFFSGWAALFMIVTAGLVLEASATGLIIRYFSKVRPDLLNSSEE